MPEALDTEIPIPVMFARLLLAMVLSTAVGWEREAKDKPAGLRTHMLVATGAAAFLLVALELAATSIAERESARLDPIRIVEGVVGGIGFLGAGTIIRARGRVEGLTTAASVWTAGAIGVACGGGHYVLAVLIAAFCIFILWGVHLLEWHVLRTKTREDDEGPPHLEDEEGGGHPDRVSGGSSGARRRRPR